MRAKVSRVKIIPAPLDTNPATVAKTLVAAKVTTLNNWICLLCKISMSDTDREHVFQLCRLYTKPLWQGQVNKVIQPLNICPRILFIVTIAFIAQRSMMKLCKTKIWSLLIQSRKKIVGIQLLRNPPKIDLKALFLEEFEKRMNLMKEESELCERRVEISSFYVIEPHVSKLHNTTDERFIDKRITISVNFYWEKIWCFDW